MLQPLSDVEDTKATTYTLSDLEHTEATTNTLSDLEHWGQN